MIAVEATQTPSEKKAYWQHKRNQALYRCLDRAVVQVENLDTSNMSYVDTLLWEDLLGSESFDNWGLVFLRDMLRAEAEIKGVNYGW